MTSDKLEIDDERVRAVHTDLERFAEALTAMRAYARAEDGLTPGEFGIIAARTGVGENYVRLRDALCGVLDKAAPVVDAMAQALAGSGRSVRAVDADVAANIAKAGRFS